MTKDGTERRVSSSGGAQAGASSRHSDAARAQRATANQEQADAEWTTAALRAPPRRLVHRPTPLEQLLDGESDASGRYSGQDNQQIVAADSSMSNVSLELLALLSPHGSTQQWDGDDLTESHLSEATAGDYLLRQRPTEASIVSKPSLAKITTSTPLHGYHQSALNLASPSEHTEPFPPSPPHSAHGDEFDMASPIALPDRPQFHEPWKQGISLDYDDEQEGDVAIADEHGSQATTPNPKIESKKEETPTRKSPSPFPRRTGRSAYSPQNYASSSTPAKSSQYTITAESKTKLRHGGIYSLLLKNRPAENEPTMIDDKTSPLGPEVSPMGQFINKKSSPPSSGKLQHGGIYGMLRRNSKNID